MWSNFVSFRAVVGSLDKGKLVLEAEKRELLDRDSQVARLLLQGKLFPEVFLEVTQVLWISWSCVSL